jgi:hypothetical protein
MEMFVSVVHAVVFLYYQNLVHTKHYCFSWALLLSYDLTVLSFCLFLFSIEQIVQEQ